VNDYQRHPASPPSNSKVVPPYIPPPRKSGEIQLYIDPECRLSKVPYEAPNNTHYVRYEDYKRLREQVALLSDDIRALTRIGDKMREMVGDHYWTLEWDYRAGVGRSNSKGQ
jgi:hypothetical protein